MSTTHLPPGSIEIPGALSYIGPDGWITKRPDWEQLIADGPVTCSTCGRTFPDETAEFLHNCERLGAGAAFIPAHDDEIGGWDNIDHRPGGEPGSGRGGHGAPPVTEAQGGLIEQLLHEIDPKVNDGDVMWVVAGYNKRTASALIDDLVALRNHLRPSPAASAPVPFGCRPNKYAGPCRHCGGHVDAQAGLLCRHDGRWLVEHNGDCPAPAARPAAAPAATSEVPAGHYAIESTGHNDLVFYRVDHVTEGEYAGRTFVKMIVGGHPDRNVRRDAVAGILDRIAAAGPEAAALRYGTELKRCCVCNITLTDEASRAAGIGPDCAAKGRWA